MADSQQERRQFLKAVAATSTVGVAGVAGCSGDSETTDRDGSGGNATGNDGGSSDDGPTLPPSGNDVGETSTTNGATGDGNPPSNDGSSGDGEGEETVEDTFDQTTDKPEVPGQEYWPQPHANACLSRYAPTVTVPSTGSLELTWEFSMEDDRKVGSGAFVGAGRVIVTGRTSGGELNTVIALNEATGEKEWKYDVDQEIDYAPIIHENGGAILTNP